MDDRFIVQNTLKYAVWQAILLFAIVGLLFEPTRAVLYQNRRAKVIKGQDIFIGLEPIGGAVICVILICAIAQTLIN
jgi:hypothetical protein